MSETTATFDVPVGLPADEVRNLPTRRIQPAKRRIRLGDIPRNFAVIRVVSVRDFKAKFKQSLMGPAWLIFQPLALLGGLAVAFGGTHHNNTGGVPYILFALVGLCVWSYFQAALTMGTASIISNYHLVRRTPCPRLAFPIGGLVATLPTLGLTVMMSVILAAAEGRLSVRVLLLPLAVVWLFVLTAGFVAFTSSVAVHLRDVLNAMPFLLQAGVFVAPIGYSTHSLSSTLRTVVELNPLTGVIEVFRWMLISGATVDTTSLWLALAGTLLVGFFGWRVFGRYETIMADII